jgi:hypothetical protein
MVELLHEYYANLQSPDFDVIPSEATRLLLQNRRMMIKTVGNKLVALIKVATDAPDADKPFISMRSDDKFVFYLQLNRPQFNIVTNIDAERLSARKRYYFTNLHQNSLDGSQKLTRQIVPVAGPVTYVPGDMAADATNTIFECIKATNQANNPPAAAFWHNRGNQQYVSGADMLSVKTTSERIALTAAAKEFLVEAYGLNLTNNQYDRSVPLKNSRYNSADPTNEIQVNLEGLPPGRYRLKINTDEFDVFVDNAMVYNNMFGVIEIFSHFANGTPFAFFDGTGKVKDKVNAGVPEWLNYKIRFANRLAYWKYNTPRHGVTAIDGGGVFTFDPTPVAPGDKDFFTSSKPIPLREDPWKFKVNVQSLASVDDPFAPNPDANLSGMLSRTGSAKDYYCTINLNY